MTSSPTRGFGFSSNATRHNKRSNRNIFMNTEPKPNIVVPTDWNAEKDFEYYEDVFGTDVDDLYSDALDRIHSSSWELVWLIDAALRWFLSAERTATEAVCCMSPCAKLQLLRYICRTTTTQSIADRLCEDITQCDAVMTLRDSILAKHLMSPEQVWLYELGQCSDWVASAGIVLLETLEIELGFPRNWNPTPPEC